MPTTPLELSELNDFAVVYRYDLLFQLVAPEKNDPIDTVHVIREHIVSRIAALSGSSAPPPVQ